MILLPGRLSSGLQEVALGKGECSRRKTMETILFGIGALVGLVLGMLLYSLWATAPEAGKLYNPLKPAKVKITPWIFTI
jgi:hypothetical protein